MFETKIRCPPEPLLQRLAAEVREAVAASWLLHYEAAVTELAGLKDSPPPPRTSSTCPSLHPSLKEAGQGSKGNFISDSKIALLRISFGLQVILCSQAITKSQAKTNEAALKKVKEAQSLGKSAVDPMMSVLATGSIMSRSPISRTQDYHRRSQS